MSDDTNTTMRHWNTLIDQMRSGSIPALSRLITLVEDRAPGWRAAMQGLCPDVRNTPTIGITGYPGSGKSTLTGQLASELVHRGKSVGIIAIDPSSHLSGGAFLGDRIRMNTLSGLREVYIRSMGTRGAIGGIHPAARDIIKLLDIFGKDYILVETVGVGQGEIDITRTTQVVLLVCAPGQGDAIQFLKAGVMEMADIYVANKMDLPEAQKMLNNLTGILKPGEVESGAPARIFATTANQGIGVAALADQIEALIGIKRSRKKWRKRLAIEEVSSLVRERLAELSSWKYEDEVQRGDRLEDLLAGRTDPYSVADEMIAKAIERMRQTYRS